MTRVIRCIIWLGILHSNLYGYPWPVRDFNTQHQISATVGEYRTTPSLHFHAGVDIPWPQSDSVFAVDSGIVDSINKWIGKFRYVHVDFKINDEDTIDSGDFVGFVNYPTEPHVHLREAPDSSNITPVVNNLFPSGLNPYVDSTNSYIDSIKFYRQGPGDTLLHNDSLSGRIDILSVAGDTRTDSTGHSAGGNCSIYRIGYLVKDTACNVVKPFWEKIMFDTIPDPSNSSQLNLTYASGSTISHFRYWVSNDPFNSNVNLRNLYWNTKQKLDQPDSVDAESIEDAKFKDGYFWVKVYAYDIEDNADSESVYVHVDNFNPKVVATYPDNWYHWIAEDEKEVWCRFSEAMDAATLVPANITIRSLVDTSHYYSIVNITYIDSLFKLVLEVDSFFFHDEVEVQLSDSITDLAGKSLEQGHSKEKCIVWIKVGTDGECAKMAHRRVPGCNNGNARQDAVKLCQNGAVMRPRHACFWQNPLQFQEIDTGHASCIMI